MKITSKGQVTIPQNFRERFWLLPNTEVEFVATVDGKGLCLVKSSRSNRGRALVERLHGRGTGKRSTVPKSEIVRLLGPRFPGRPERSPNQKPGP
jgi:AbrB family looped-hinge helix DNA binding protein